MIDYVIREDVLKILSRKSAPWDSYRLVRELPAADVRPIIRGHWITEEEAEAKGNYLLRDTCSVCGRCDWDDTESKYFNFCPNCGAMMEES